MKGRYKEKEDLSVNYAISCLKMNRGLRVKGWTVAYYNENTDALVKESRRILHLDNAIKILESMGLGSIDGFNVKKKKNSK